MRSAFALLALLAVVARADTPAPIRRVDLVPLGAELPAGDVDAVRAALVGIYGVEVRVRPGAPLPRAAYYPPRRRWRAEKLLEWLEALPADGADRLLGLTGVDISTTKDAVPDWGVLGLGSLDGRVGVLSRFRCDKGGGHPRRARTRLAKVAVHELGHTLGLDHCPQQGCLMEDAAGKVATTDGEVDLCPRCRALLAGRGQTLPSPPRAPWR